MYSKRVVVGAKRKITLSIEMFILFMSIECLVKEEETNARFKIKASYLVS